MNKLWIKTKNKKSVRIIKKLSSLNINLYEIKYDENYLYLKVNETDYERINKYIVTYKFTIHDSVGIKKLKHNFQSKLIFNTVSLLGIILFFIFNNMIVNVEIYHENTILKEIILEELWDNNIKPLTIKKSYEELEVIKETIKNKYPDKIDWIEIETVGMKYVVKLEERIITEEKEEPSYCNIYASQSGMISKVYIERGVALVKAGDYVKEGDLLISGDIYLNEEIVEEVCAKGVVYATRWYETSITVPLSNSIDVKTGKSRYNLLLEHENNKNLILNNRIDNYITEHTLLFDIFGYKLYLEKQEEVEEKEVKYTYEEALNEANRLVLEKMNDKLDSSEKVIEQKVLKKVENNSTIEVDIFIVTEEVIN